MWISAYFTHTHKHEHTNRETTTDTHLQNTITKNNLNNKNQMDVYMKVIENK